jgi:hypothetical protein
MSPIDTKLTCRDVRYPDAIEGVFRSLRLGRFGQLLDDVKFDLCNTPSNHP